MDKPYRRTVEHFFRVEGIGYSLTESGEKWGSFEETRKNGQEDCHCSGVVSQDPETGAWFLAEGRETIELVEGKEHTLAIERFFDENGLPNKLNTEQ